MAFLVDLFGRWLAADTKNNTPIHIQCWEEEKDTSQSREEEQQYNAGRNEIGNRCGLDCAETGNGLKW